MRLRILFAFLCALTLIAQDSITSGDWRSWLNRGIEAYKSARYREAVEDFQKSISLNPNEPAPHLYLATAWMVQYIPGAVSPENLNVQRNAATEFARVLELDSKNLAALKALALLHYLTAEGTRDLDEKARELDEAADWDQRVLAVDPRDSEAYYSLGAIAWAKWYPNLMRARAQLGMRPEQPGPLSNATVRRDLRARYSALIADGMANLGKALEIDPRYDYAMTYMNMFVRERADLLDTPEEYRRDIEVADQWVQKALAANATKVRSSSMLPQPWDPHEALTPARMGGIIGGIIGSIPTDALPPPSPDRPYPAPQRIHVAADVMRLNLTRKVDPVYSKLAQEARIEGVVRFTAIIGKAGRIENLTLVSGHPLLIEAARQAVAHWEYKPVLLNGEPVEIVTTIDVTFTLQQ